MSMDLLRRIAASRLPLMLRSAEEIDQVRILRAAGLVIAFVPAPDDALRSGPEQAAQVLALTQKGLEELNPVLYPRQPSASKAGGEGVGSRLSRSLQQAKRLL